jgi:solute:Na+ symporter, SSS family
MDRQEGGYYTMPYLGVFDYGVIVVYFSFLVALGLVLKKRASASLDDYFIGGRNLPWWALGASGMASFLDVAGTMIIVSFLYMLGPRGLFIEFRGGAVLCLVFFLLWAGKWFRRSQCLTGAEWMIFRFGDGPGGRFAQFVTALAGVVTTVGMLAYLIKGIGLFLSMFFPFPPLVCALALVGVATIYTMVSGFYGVVFTDLFQSVVILISVVFISYLAMSKVATVPDMGAFAAEVTGNPNWMSTTPQWKTPMPVGYEQYESLIIFAALYLLKNVIAGMGFVGDPKYFGARNDRECGSLTFLWTCLMTVRWPMMIGFAALGIFLVHDLFPDMGMLTQAADLIKQHHEGVKETQWAGLVSGIINSPTDQAPALISGLEGILGVDWAGKLHLVSFNGTVNPERILPAVLLFNVPMGMRGLLLIALLAASMSTFDSTVNATTGLVTRDIYQKHIHPKATTKELIYISWVTVALLVIVAFVFAYSIKSINDIWGWIIMGLGGGLMIPHLLKLYWWRFNGGGFAVGLGVGMTAAILQRLFFPDLDERLQFLVLGSIGMVATIVGTYLTPPTDDAVVARFYRKTRPFGFWGPYRKHLSPEEQKAAKLEHRHDLLAVPFNLTWQVSMFLMSMQAIIGAWTAFAYTSILFLIGLIGMYFLWYRYLPKENFFEDDDKEGTEHAQEI